MGPRAHNRAISEGRPRQPGLISVADEASCLSSACPRLPPARTGSIGPPFQHGFLGKGDVILTRSLELSSVARAGDRVQAFLCSNTRETNVPMSADTVPLAANWVFPHADGKGNYIWISIRSQAGHRGIHTRAALVENGNQWPRVASRKRSEKTRDMTRRLHQQAASVQARPGLLQSDTLARYPEGSRVGLLGWQSWRSEMSRWGHRSQSRIVCFACLLWMTKRGIQRDGLEMWWKLIISRRFVIGSLWYYALWYYTL